MSSGSVENIIELPDVALEKILSYLSYDGIAKNRLVCHRFNNTCQRLLNRGFYRAIHFHAKCFKDVKSKLPRRESKRPDHPLARHNNVLSAVDTRLSLLKMTFLKYIHSNSCCFIPGKVVDELFRILRLVSNSERYPVPHDLLTELRDISSMAMDYFDEKIVPTLKVPAALSTITSLSQDLIGSPGLGESSSRVDSTFGCEYLSGASSSMVGGAGLFSYSTDMLNFEMKGAIDNLTPSLSGPQTPGGSGCSPNNSTVSPEQMYAIMENIKKLTHNRKSKLEKQLTHMQKKIVELSRKVQDQDRIIHEQRRLLAEHSLRFNNHSDRINEIINSSVTAEVMSVNSDGSVVIPLESSSDDEDDEEKPVKADNFEVSSDSVDELPDGRSQSKSPSVPSIPSSTFEQAPSLSLSSPLPSSTKRCHEYAFTSPDCSSSSSDESESPSPNASKKLCDYDSDDGDLCEALQSNKKYYSIKNNKSYFSAVPPMATSTPHCSGNKATTPGQSSSSNTKILPTMAIERVLQSIKTITKMSSSLNQLSRKSSEDDGRASTSNQHRKTHLVSDPLRAKISKPLKSSVCLVNKASYSRRNVPLNLGSVFKNKGATEAPQLASQASTSASTSKAIENETRKLPGHKRYKKVYTTSHSFLKTPEGRLILVRKPKSSRRLRQNKKLKLDNSSSLFSKTEEHKSRQNSEESTQHEEEVGGGSSLLSKEASTTDK